MKDTWLGEVLMFARSWATALLLTVLAMTGMSCVPEEDEEAARGARNRPCPVISGEGDLPLETEGLPVE